MMTIPPGAIVLTPNQRMALWWQRKQPSIQVTAYSWTTWIEQLWEQACQLRFPGMAETQILSLAAQEIVWEKQIQRTLKTRPLMRILPTARLAIQAWEQVKTWDLPLEESQFCEQEDNRWFWIWAQGFDRWCKQHQALDFVGQTETVIDLIGQRVLRLPKQVVALGFVEFTPQQNRLWQALQSVGVQWQQATLLNSRPSDLKGVSAIDQEQEFIAACTWAKKSLIAKKSHFFSIGIVVPQLPVVRAEIARLAKRHLPSGCYNIAAPQTLLDYPIIQAALQGLILAKKRLTFQQVSQALRNPCFGAWSDEQEARLSLEGRLRQWASVEIRWSALLRESTKFPLLQAQWSTLAKLRSAWPLKHTAENWVEAIREWLKTLGWPGERVLGAIEQAVLQQWEKILAQYLGLSPLLKVHRFSTAVFRLQRIARHHRHALASEAEPIQILGSLEAAGLPFESLWIMGLDQNQWPQDPEPNPFLPYALQKKHALPRSSAARELAVAKQRLVEFQRAAPNLVFSFARQREGQTKHPSRLLPLGVVWETLKIEANIETGKSSAVKINFSDLNESGPPFTQLEQPVPGGTKVLSWQSQCPFRAFAEVRLNAKAWPEPKLGLSLVQRGTILHELLNRFWQSLQDQAQLLTLSEEDLRKIIENLIQEVLMPWQTNHALTSSLWHLEKTRLRQLMLRWTEVEKQRPPFRVLATEQQQWIDIQGLRLKIRLDRVDALVGEEDQESRIVIDYKTRPESASIQTWLGQSLLEPQLPLYAVSQAILPDAISFGIVHSDAVLFRGVGAVNAFRGIQIIENWSGQIQTWKTALETLAQDFIRGHANVSPAEGEKTCRHCHLSSLCRVFELRCQIA